MRQPTMPPDTQADRADFLIEYLLTERGQCERAELPASLPDKERLLRSLMNLRPPLPASEDFLAVQNQYLKESLAEKGVVKIQDLRPIQPGIYLWQGDITRLAADAIVNAANSQLLGCFVPCHGCIDNAIHTWAGVQLRLDCARIMAGQKAQEPAGKAKITKAYNLPCRYVLHTVGPIIYGAVTKTDCGELAGCYRSCLELAASYGLKAVAFCCISTGEFHFPNELAAKIAIKTVREWQQKNPNQMEVIFNVFKDRDYEIYKRLLG